MLQHPHIPSWLKPYWTKRTELIVLAVVGLLGVGAFVAGRSPHSAPQATTVTSKPKVQTNTPITKENMPTADSPTIAGTSDPEAEKAQKFVVKLPTYTSKFEGVTLTYPTNWRLDSLEGQSADTTSVEFHSPGDKVLAFLAARVDQGSVMRPCTSDETNDSLKVTYVQKLAATATTKTLYLIRFTAGTDKASAVTDWGGAEPTVGTSTMCNFPSYAGHSGTPVWLRYTTSTDYQSLSAEKFYAHPDIQAAEAILTSAAYK